MRIANAILICWAIGLSPVFSQSIFDEEPSISPEHAPGDENEEAAPKPVKAKKKKRAKKKKKATTESGAAVKSRIEYTPEELAKSSYLWAPEAEFPALASSAPGMKANVPGIPAKAEGTAEGPAAIEAKPAQPIRLPQIPLTQVLIVAGFVILFLIYRFRVGKQIKRKKY